MYLTTKNIVKQHTFKYLNVLEDKDFDLQGQIILRERFQNLQSLFLHIKNKTPKEWKLWAFDIKGRFLLKPVFFCCLPSRTREKSYR